MEIPDPMTEQTPAQVERASLLERIATARLPMIGPRVTVRRLTPILSSLTPTFSRVVLMKAR